MKLWLIILLVILGVGLLIGLIFLVSLGGLEWQKFFKPKVKEIERDVWEETPSRILGAQQEIAKSMREYNEVESQLEKDAICAYLRNSYPDITGDEIDDYKLRTFFEMCKYGEY